MDYLGMLDTTEFSNDEFLINCVDSIKERRCDKLKIVLDEENKILFKDYFFIDYGYFGYNMVHNDSLNYAEFTKTRVLLLDFNILDIKDLLPTLEYIAQNSQETIVIIARGFSEQVLKTASLNIDNGSFFNRICFINVGDDMNALKDLSKLLHIPIMSGMHSISDNSFYEKMPYVSQVIIFEDKTYFGIEKVLVLKLHNIRTIATIHVKDSNMLERYEKIFATKNIDKYIKEKALSVIGNTSCENIIISQGYSVNTYVQKIPALVIPHKLLSAMVDDNKKMDLQNVVFMALKEPIDTIDMLLPFLEDLVQTGLRMYIVAPFFSEDVISILDFNNRQGTTKCYCAVVSDEALLDTVIAAYNNRKYAVNEIIEISIFKLPRINRIIMWEDRVVFIKDDYSNNRSLQDILDIKSIDSNSTGIWEIKVGGCNKKIQKELYTHYSEYIEQRKNFLKQCRDFII